MKTIPHTLRPYTAALLLITCCILLLASCEKDPYRHGEPDLPPITMEGKNTLGFLLNGKVWVPYQDKPGIFTPTLEVSMSNNSFIIEARLNNKKLQREEKLAILFTCFREGIYFSNADKSIFISNQYGDCRNFNVDNKNDIIVDIYNFDSSKRIISGKFMMKNLIDECNMDTLQITEGRFDLKF